MKVNLEIYSSIVTEAIDKAMSHINMNDIVNSVASAVLDEIVEVIKNEAVSDDFYVVEEIVCIFEKYNIDTGFRHDF